MNELVTRHDVIAVGDRLIDRLDAVKTDLVRDIRELGAEVHRVYRRTLLTLIAFMTVLNVVTFTAYTAVLNS